MENIKSKVVGIKDVPPTRRRYQIVFKEPTCTQHSFTKEVEINNLIKRYKTTGELPPVRPAFYGDVSNVPDYRTALDLVNRANDSFASLPSEVRSYFKNDPQLMVNWMTKDENYDKAVELGLVVRRPEDGKKEPEGEKPKA